MPVDIVREALASNATFIARAFSGDVSQLREIIKAALSHEGIAVIDVISPCVSFNNEDDAHHSYSWGREHEVAIHDLAYVPPREEIEIDYDETSTKTVTMHDGSLIVLKKIKEGHDISSRVKAVNLLDEADEKGILLTGSFYINTQQENLVSIKNLPDEPLNRMTEERLRPSAEALTQVNNALF